MDPGEMAIAARDEMVELRLLRDPEDAERQKTHQIGNKAEPKRSQLAPQHVLVVLVSRLDDLLNCLSYRYMKVEHEQRHRDREDPVAEGCKSLYTLAGDKVVRCPHSSAPNLE